VSSYAERVNKKNDHEIVSGFLEHVRNGVGPTSFERDLLAELITTAGAEATA
jgi:exonuclease SbcD